MFNLFPNRHNVISSLWGSLPIPHRQGNQSGLQITLFARIDTPQKW